MPPLTPPYHICTQSPLFHYDPREPRNDPSPNHLGGVVDGFPTNQNIPSAFAAMANQPFPPSAGSGVRGLQRSPQDAEAAARMLACPPPPGIPMPSASWVPDSAVASSVGQNLTPGTDTSSGSGSGSASSGGESPTTAELKDAAYDNHLPGSGIDSENSLGVKVSRNDVAQETARQVARALDYSDA